MNNKSSSSLWSHPAGKIFLSVCLWQITAFGLLYNSFSLFIKPIAAYNSFTIAAVSMITSIMAFVAALALNAPGRLMGKVSSRTWFTTIGIGLALVYFGYSNAQELWHFYTLAILNGVFAGMGIFVTPQLIIPNWFIKSGTYLGIAAGCGGAGAIIGAPIFAYVIQTWSYSAGFMLGAALALFILVPLGLFAMKFRPEEIGAKPYGSEELEAQQAASVGSGEVKTPVFEGYTEKEARKMPHYWLMWLFALIVPTFATIFIHVPGALQDKGLSVLVAGSVLGVYQFGVMIGQMFIGWCNDNIGLAWTTVLYTGLAMVTTMFLAFYNLPTVWLLSIAVFVMGVVRAMPNVHMPLIVKNLFGMKEYSKIFSAYYMVTVMASASYFVLMGWIKDVTGSYAGAFLVITGVAAVCMILLLVILHLGRKQEEKRLAGDIR